MQIKRSRGFSLKQMLIAMVALIILAPYISTPFMDWVEGKMTQKAETQLVKGASSDVNRFMEVKK